MNHFDFKTKPIHALYLFALLILLGWQSKPAHAQSRAPRVGINGANCAYETIGAAVAAASAGDTIYIRGRFGSAQPYPERIGLVNKSLTFVPASDDCTSEITSGLLTSNIIIDNNGAAASSGGIIEIRGASTSVTIKTMTLRDASAGSGGIIFVSEGSLTLEGTNITQGTATSVSGGGPGGGGVYVFDGQLIMNGSTRITNNVANGDGGGVRLFGGASLQMNDTSSISGNDAVNGGGLYLSHGSSVTMSDSARITVNDATDGGGIYAGGLFPAGGGSTITLEDSAFIGGAFSPTGNTRNTATNEGGGVYLNNTDHLIMRGDSEISANTAKNGGGVHAERNVTIELSGNANIGGVEDYDGNTASGTSATTGRGGGIHFSTPDDTAAQLTMTGFSGIRNNKANSTTPTGGGIYAGGNIAIVMSEAAALEQNSSTYEAGGAYLSFGASMTISGRTVISGNVAALNGGGVHLYGGKLIVDSSAAGRPRFANNDANSGGAVYARERNVGDDQLTINGADFFGNSASLGGGLYVQDVVASLTNTVFGDNSASSGGGLYINTDGTVTMDTSWDTTRGVACNQNLYARGRYCSEFNGNTAAFGAAVIVRGSADFSHTSFSENIGTGSAESSIIDVSSSGEARFSTVLIADNTDADRALVFRETTAPQSIDHATFGNNSGHPILTDSSTGTLTISNSIIQENDEGPAIENGMTLSISCNNVQTTASGFQAFAGDTINADPQWFTNFRGNYFLTSGSPSIDTCSSSATVDMENLARPVNGQHDMGAFENDGSAPPTAVALKGNEVKSAAILPILLTVLLLTLGTATMLTPKKSN